MSCGCARADCIVGYRSACQPHDRARQQKAVVQRVDDAVTVNIQNADDRGVDTPEVGTVMALFAALS